LVVKNGVTPVALRGIMYTLEMIPEHRLTDLGFGEVLDGGLLNSS